MNSKDKIKQEKEALCMELLKADPGLGLKAINEEVRKKFDSGIAPPVFSKIKKALAEPSVEKSEEKETVELKEKKPVKKSAKKTKEVEVKLEEESTASEQSEKAEKTEETEETEKAEETEETEKAEAEQEVVEEEPEIPVEKYPFKIRIEIPGASTVFIAGSFNKWKKDEYRLEREEGDWWVYDDKLPEGEHNYKFVVNSREWFVDFDKEIVVDNTGVSNTLVVEVA
jgi:hypothetical protein